MELNNFSTHQDKFNETNVTFNNEHFMTQVEEVDLDQADGNIFAVGPSTANSLLSSREKHQ